MDESPLNDLPAGLRNEIYSYVLELPEDVEIDCLDWKITDAVKTDLKSAIALLSTCRQSHHEGLPVLLSGNRFVFQTHLSRDSDHDEDEDTLSDIIDRLQRWTQKLGVYSVHLKHIEFTTCEWIAHMKYDNYLCDFYPSALKHLSEAFAETRAQPALRVKIICDRARFCTDLLVIVQDKQQANKVVQSAQKNMDSSVDSCSKEPNNAGLVREIKTSKKTLQRFLIALQAPK